MTKDINAPLASEQVARVPPDKRLLKLNLELQALDHRLTGDLSTCTRADVVEMNERALALQHALVSGHTPAAAPR